MDRQGLFITVVTGTERIRTVPDPFFQPAIEKAKVACEQAGMSINDHFADVRKMVSLGSGSERDVDNLRHKVVET